MDKCCFLFLSADGVNVVLFCAFQETTQELFMSFLSLSRMFAYELSLPAPSRASNLVILLLAVGLSCVSAARSPQDVSLAANHPLVRK